MLDNTKLHCGADERKQIEVFQNILHLFEMIHIDNMRVLKALIYQKDDQQPLVDGDTKRRVSNLFISYILTKL